tara:strand:+ start:1394 stop:2068 length:675 start_codon:yes stop_codon:yes gene_type:complete
MNDLTLVIPAKYESESLPIFLNELSDTKCKKLIVLEESDKNTINSIKHFQDIEILYQSEKGYGAALIEGVSNCSTEYFCIINADGSMNPNYLVEMIKVTKNENLDFLFASRYGNALAGSDDDNIITSIGNYVFTKIGNIFFSLEITDILYTYVMGKTDSFNNLELKSNNFTICVELPIKAKRDKYLLGTIPSYERSRFGGKKKVNAFKDGFLILLKLISMFFKR